MRLVAVMIALSLLAAAPAPAQAGDKGMSILKKYEKKYLSFKGLVIEFKLLVGRSGRMKLKARFTARNRPSGQRLSLMTYPGDIKGMQMLVQSPSEMYIYLPAFKRVRRIAGHVRNQGFLGSGFTYDDLAIHKWSTMYRVKLIKTTRRLYWLDLKAIRGKGARYRHVKMSIRRDIHLAESFRYFNAHGKNFKTQKFLRYKCKSDKSHCNPRLIRIVEHTRRNRRSDLVARKIRYTSRLNDRMFTVRHLLRSAN